MLPNWSLKLRRMLLRRSSSGSGRWPPQAVLTARLEVACLVMKGVDRPPVGGEEVEPIGGPLVQLALGSAALATDGIGSFCTPTSGITVQ